MNTTSALTHETGCAPRGLARSLASFLSIPRPRLTSLCAGLVALPLALAMPGCGGSIKQAGDAKAVDEDSNEVPKDSTSTSASSAPASDKPAPGSQDEGSTGPKKDECTAFEIPNLEEVLLKSSCEVDNPKPDEKPLDPKKVEVKLATSTAKIPVGGHTDLTVIFTNKSKETIPLRFTIDPMPRFEVEVYDAKNARVDMPKGSAPMLPAGTAPRVPGEPRTARVNLAANGTARMTLPWDAVKTKWAPEKLKGTPPEKGYPRAPNGPLPKGVYTIKVITPLVGVFEGIDHEVSAPLTKIEITK